MDSPRERTLESARRAMDKGRFANAVNHYEQLLRQDPADIKTQLYLADAYFQSGKLEPALQVYFDVALFYREAGSPLKAVAVYKEMLRIDTGLHVVHIALAQVYRQLGLLNDSISQYQDAIRVAAQRGDARTRLAVISELLELDDENIRARVRLTEDFVEEQCIEQAVSELRKVSELLAREKRVDAYITVCERLLHLKPDEHDIARKMAVIYMSQEQADLALFRLSPGFRSQPDDIEQLELIAKCFEMLGQSQKAITVLREMANIHERHGVMDERDDALARILSFSPADVDARARLSERFQDMIVSKDNGISELTLKSERGDVPPQEDLLFSAPQESDAADSLVSDSAVDLAGPDSSDSSEADDDVLAENTESLESQDENVELPFELGPDVSLIEAMEDVVVDSLDMDDLVEIEADEVVEDAEIEAEPVPVFDTEIEPELEVETEPEPEAEAESASESEPEVVSDVEVEGVPEAVLEAELEAEPEFEVADASEPASVPEPEFELEELPVADAEPESEPEPEIEPEVELETTLEVEVEPEVELEELLDTQVEVEPEAVPIVEEETGQEPETAPAQEPESASDSQSIYVDLADELKEFDFYFRGGLMDDARSVLDELPPKYAEHPEVTRRRWMLDL